MNSNRIFIGAGLLCIILVLPFLSGCTGCTDQQNSDSQQQINLAGRKDISSEEFQKLTDTGHKIQLLDVRSRGEFDEGHISGALNIPYQEIISSPDIVQKKDYEATVVYCESGHRSKKAQGALMDSGFSNVLHLSGDMAEWRSRQLPIETSN